MPREKAFRSLYKTVTSVLRIDFSLETHDFVLDKIPQILVYTGVLKKKKNPAICRNCTWTRTNALTRFHRGNLMQLAYLESTFQVFFFSEEVAAVRVITADGCPCWL